MNTLRQSLDTVPGLRYVTQQLQLSSSPGRIALLDSKWGHTEREVESRLSMLDRMICCYTQEQNRSTVNELALILEELHHIEGTVEILRDPKGCCSDVDFYEIKKLALMEEKVGRLCGADFPLYPLPSLAAVRELLDPEGERIPSFYLADGFDVPLRNLRYQLKEATSEEERDRLALECAQREDHVRRRLTRQLSTSAGNLLGAYGALAQQDLLIAKARWCAEQQWVRPAIKGEGTTLLQGLVHPEVQELLRREGDTFQPVDISLCDTPALITGANMSGKSVLLASIGLAQALTQYGFYVPARVAEVVLVNEICYSMGDGQNIGSGLSSFGAEMLRLNHIVGAMKGNLNVLALIDEPARTTNPDEGHAIVEALVALIAKYHGRAVLTTHYSGVEAPCRRWKVRGFVEERVTQPLEINRLNKCIDYTLTEVERDEETPREALRIAEILGVDSELLSLCKLSLKPNQ